MTTDADREAAQRLLRSLPTLPLPSQAMQFLADATDALATARAEGREESEQRIDALLYEMEACHAEKDDLRRANDADAYTRGWQAAREAAAQVVLKRAAMWAGRDIAALIRALPPPPEQETP